MCGRAAVKIECGDCAAPHLVPYRCGCRTCPTCTKSGAAAIVGRVASRVDQLNRDFGVGGYPGPVVPWDGQGAPRRRGWKHVVLTTPAPVDPDLRFDPVYLRRKARQTRGAWGRFWRATPWGRQVNDRRADGSRYKRARVDTAYALGLEVSPRGMVHIHAAIFGEYVPQAELADAWRRALGETRSVVVHVTALRGDSADVIRKSLREVLKYATKGEKGGRRVRRAAAVELALRGLRRVEVGGALRRYGPVKETLQQEDLHAGGVAACAVCAAVGHWVWMEIRGPELVTANGGYGLLSIEDLGRQSERNSYFGGDPPEWHDEAEDAELYACA